MNRLLLLVFGFVFVYVCLFFMGCDSDSDTSVDSTSGNYSWNEVSLLPDTVSDTVPVSNLYSITFPSAATGWITGDAGTIYRTDDTGKTWQLIYYNQSIWLFDIFSTDNTNLWAAGMTGNYPYRAVILNSTDAGANWTFVPLMDLNAQLTSIKFTDAQNGYAVGGSWPLAHDNRFLLYTSDGGATWDTTYSYVDSSISIIDTIEIIDTILNDTSYNYDTSYYYIDSISIDSIDIDPDLINKVDQSRFYDIDFGSPNSGCVVGANNMIMTSNDIYSLWGCSNSLPITAIHFNEERKGIQLYSVDMIDDFNGWAVGSFDIIMNTIDGGTTWTVQHIDSSKYNSLRSISFLDANNGVAVGDGGRVLITDNAGSSWDDISYISSLYGYTPLYDNDLSDVVYLNLNKIIIVAEDMLVLISK